jgi:hypothetical protein
MIGSSLKIASILTDDPIEYCTKVVAEQYAWELYLVALDLLEGSIDGRYRAEAAAKVIVAKVAALETKG